MLTTIKQLIIKYKRLILYAVFGVFTTIVNIAAYAVCARLFGMPTVPATIVAWVLAVFFAYVTNRRLVFDSQVRTARGILIEITMFFLFRILTGVLDIVIMYIFVDVYHFDDVIIKTASNIIVIILNYLASKLIIFRKKKNRKKVDDRAELD